MEMKTELKGKRTLERSTTPNESDAAQPDV